MGHFIYLIRQVRPEALTEGFTESESRAMSDHYEYLRGMTRKGVVLLAGPTLNTDNSNFGLVVLKAETEKEARDIMHNDPSVINRVVRAELYPFRASLFNPAGADSTVSS